MDFGKLAYYYHKETDLTCCLFIAFLRIGTPYDDKLFYEVLMDSARSLNETQIFNNASQAWNNDFFLRSLVRNSMWIHGDFKTNLDLHTEV